MADLRAFNVNRSPLWHVVWYADILKLVAPLAGPRGGIFETVLSVFNVSLNRKYSAAKQRQLPV
ncbi:hypothetical protein Brsp01_34980 [Brucella sp. NBRC 12950]|nr:hypothetical protein Brsp01_34980 [Brucella sp. NBRC 12950]